MPAGHSQRNPTPDSPQDHQSSPANSKTTHIRNKDGTKLITVPSRKVSNPESISAAPSPPPPPPPPAPMDYSNGANSNSVAGKKKKKKRGKQMLQAQQQLHSASENHTGGNGYNGTTNSSAPPPPPHHPHHYQQDIKDSMAGFDDDDNDDDAPDLVDPDDEDEYYSDQEGTYDDDEPYSPPRSAPAPVAGKAKKNKKKKKKAVGGGIEHLGGGQAPGRKGKDRIWNTSTSEERERIKDFWLSLGEEERRSLVKVEKEAVLRKMKEQQKHSCSCSVCGRKRTAIEEELEVLYDAYYEELEQYANQQQTSKYLSHVPPMPPLGTYASSNIPPPPPPPPGPPPHSHHGNHDHGDHNHKTVDLDDEFEDDDDEDYEDEEDVLDHPMSPPPPDDSRHDFFNFGNSLTVQGGILTVADDLLKNDGKKFIEMMEQLAERRMAREEEANSANGTVQREANLHHHVHNHAQPSDYDDEEYDDEDDEDEEYDDEEEEDEEPDTMTEEQRMEEGRRMFQIFAARMFEQRVLTAYREKVARERQRKLLEELEEEERRKEEREEKKAKDKDKKKEKKRQQKQAKEEERLRKEAEKREEEEKQRAIEARKSEEQRRRKEEQRLKREAERKAAEEEKQRKEEEKRKRLQEEREREAERERKRKEHQERERKKREEAAKKVREEKEAREKETREKREREDREKREKEVKAKKDAAEKERKRKEEEAKARADATAAAAKRSQAFAQQPAISHTQTAPPPGYGSPHLPVVTPATPKLSAGAQLHGSRPRNSSQQGSMQGSQCSSPKTPNVGPRIGTSASPSTPVLQQSIPGPTPVKFQFPGFLQTSPMPHHIGPPPGVTPPESIFNMSPMGMNGPNTMQPFLPGMPQRQTIANGVPIFSPGQIPIGHSPQYRGFTSNGLPMPIPQPPGMRPMSNQGRGGLFMPEIPHHLPPGVPLPPPGSPFINRVDPIPMSGHSRIPSGSFDPMHRPTPIQRPSSVAPPRIGDDQLEELSKVMGSRALLEDDDEPLPENMSPVRRVSGPQFSPRPIRGVPNSSVLFGDTLGGFNDFGVGASWSNPLPLGGSLSGSLPSAWANKAGWSDIDAGTYNRRRTTRVDTIRLLACQKFRELSGPSNQPVEISTLQRAIQQTAPPELQYKQEELPYTLDVEGDPQNGGGSFEQRAENGRILVYYSSNQNPHGPIRAGEIGSPSTTGAVPFKTPLGAPPGMASPAGF